MTHLSRISRNLSADVQRTVNISGIFLTLALFALGVDGQ